MRNTTVALLLAASALSACATPSAFSPPQAALPASYSQAATAAGASTDRWWTSFGDPQLDALVDEVLAKNNDLAAAAILVRRAQLQARLTATNAIPTFGAGGSATHSTESGNSINASGSVAYEVDLFGKLGAEREASRWEAEATAQDLEATRLSLIGTTADLYWQLGSLNERLALANDSLAYAKQTLDLVTAQRAAGAVSDIELNEARQSVETQSASIAALEQSRTETRQALALLKGEPTWTVAAEPTTLSNAAMPAVESGAPAELLGRRPDLRAAELRLREGLANVDVARASFYPSISLTGSAGGSSAALTNLLANPVAVLGGGVNLPFLNWTQLNLDLKVSKTDYEHSVVQFRQTLLQAFSDVQTALSARTQLAAQGDRLAASLTAAQTTERLYEVRYRAGAVPLRTYLEAQQQRRTAEQALVQNRLSRLQAQVTLYKAVGGSASA